MESKEKLTKNESKFSSLMNLIKRESIEEIKEVLQKWSYLLKYRDKSSRTPLHFCSEHSSALCADLILDKCPDLLSAQDNDGYTALHLSVICGNQLITRYLISKSDVNLLNLCDNESHTAIHWATVCGELECLDLLLNSGAHPSRADIHGAYPIHYSAQMCSPHSGICVKNDSRIGLAVLNRLLRNTEVDVNCVDNDGRTPLLWAASAGSGDALLILINAGANVTSKDKDGLTALHCASSRGHIDCVETLITLCGADINQMDTNGCPPLFYAVTLGHADCTRVLIESGADVNVQDFKGRTAAHCGAARGQLETIKILGQLGANLWLRNVRGDLPLHEAVKSGRKELVKWLLDQIPAAVNATNLFGRSALHIAAINNNIEMSKILIDIGADVNTVMKLKGHFITPLDAALQKGYRGVAKYLLLHGALPASRISHNLNKTVIQRLPSAQRPVDSFTTYENSSPIDSLDEWKIRTDDSSDSALHSQTQSNRMGSSRTQLPKLPTLVTNADQMPETSSSTTSSVMENGNHIKNVREFDTPLNDRPTNLKQAIITNVYVTNTPICHSKRVPPLKKVKKKRKSLYEKEDSKALRVYTPSMSSSSSLINGEDNGFKVVLETKDKSNFKLNESTNKELTSDKEFEEMYLNTDDNEVLSQNEIQTNQVMDGQKEEEVIQNEVISDKSKFTDTQVLTAEVSEVKEQTIDDRDKVVLEPILAKELAKSDKISETKDKTTETMKAKEIEIQSTVSKNEAKTKTTQNSEMKTIKDNLDLSENEKQEIVPKVKARKEFETKLNKLKENPLKRDKSSDRKSELVSDSSLNTRSDDKNKTLSDHKSDSDSLKQKSVNKKNIVKKSSTVRTNGKEIVEKSKEVSNLSGNEKQKIVPKVKARKEFETKMNKLKENSLKGDESSDPKSELVSDSSLNTRSDDKKAKEFDKMMENIDEDNRDIDSITYIKSDEESVKSAISSAKKSTDRDVSDLQTDLDNDIKTESEKHIKTESVSDKSLKTSEIDIKSDKSLKTSEIDIKSDKSSKKIEIQSKKSSEKEENGENEYYDQWESDSERTVIDSDNKQLSEDFNNNSVGKINTESESKIENKNKDLIELKTTNENKTIIKDNRKLSETKAKVKHKEVKTTKDKIESKNLTKSIENSEKQKNKKNIKTNTKKSENKLSTNDKSIKDNKQIKGQKINNNKQIIGKTSSVSKIKDKNNTRDLLKPIDSLENKSFLSTSDMSLNKSIDNKNELKTNQLKNSISNQEININESETKQKLTNFSSDESIFDSALVIEEMERNDSQMYSSLMDQIYSNVDTLSPLEHIERTDYSPDREQFHMCTEYCDSSQVHHQCHKSDHSCHKSESRCSHRYHFKTMPATVGKVEVRHIGSRVDSIRDNRYTDNATKYNRQTHKRIRRVRPSSDGYKSVDLNLITQTVEKSLRKYQLERKLFEELHDLKRFQIRSGRSNEILMVKRLVDKFRKDVKAPGMTDFDGPYTYKNYEYYLYDQLRKLSTSNQGKVALLTRSLSHENIQLIKNSNENITQSNPEIVTNSEGLDVNQQNSNDLTQSADDIHGSDYQSSKQLLEKPINELHSETSNLRVDVEVKEIETILESNQIESSSQRDLGNDREINLNNFDIESERDYTHFDRTSLEHRHSDRDTTLTTTTNHYQTNGDIIAETHQTVEEISKNTFHSIEEPIDISEQNIENSSTNISNEKNIESEKQNNSLTEINEQIQRKEFKELYEEQEKHTSVDRSEQNSDLHSNYTTNEQNDRILDDFDKSVKQSSNQKSKTKSIKSSESQRTDQISEAKSRNGSLKSENLGKRITNSSSSRKSTLSSIKSTNNRNTGKRKATEKQKSFKKECLKPVANLGPSERAKNRPKFKRLKMKIPPKHEMNISIDSIRKRWNDIKESELKKALILSAHKPNNEFILWYELNKYLKNRFSSFDLEFERAINENRNSLQRTHSDSALNKYKLDSKQR